MGKLIHEAKSTGAKSTPHHNGGEQYQQEYQMEGYKQRVRWLAIRY